MSGKRIALSASALGVLTAWAIAWGVNENEANTSEEPGYSDSGPRWGHRHRGDMAGRMARHLDLTEEQQARIRTIFAEARTEGGTLRAQLADMRSELQSSIRENGYYEDQVRVMVESKAPLFVELTMLGIRTMSQVYAELTPEQQARADEMLEKRGGRFGPGGFLNRGF